MEQQRIGPNGTQGQGRPTCGQCLHALKPVQNISGNELICFGGPPQMLITPQGNAQGRPTVRPNEPCCGFFKPNMALQMEMQRQMDAQRHPQTMPILKPLP